MEDMEELIKSLERKRADDIKIIEELNLTI
jgi:uncharacterized coiled-coil protein SlyX